MICYGYTNEVAGERRASARFPVVISDFCKVEFAGTGEI